MNGAMGVLHGPHDSDIGLSDKPKHVGWNDPCLCLS
jgi:hypothetical protein